MKIVDLRWTVIEGNFDWTLVKVYTDEGISGVGECFWGVGAEEMFKIIKPLLIGENPLEVGRLYEKLIRMLSGIGTLAGTSVTAITAIEIALWDLTGRALNVPVYQLLGGKFRDKIRLYADCHAGVSLEYEDGATFAVWHENKTESKEAHKPEAYAKRARAVKAQGYTAMKFDLDVPSSVQLDSYNRCLSNKQLADMEDIVAAVREAVGEEIDLAMDCHWQYNVNDAIKLAQRLEKYNLMWLEDPIPPENIDAQLKVTSSTRTPICTGENLYRKHGFRELIEKQAVDIVAPDISKMGGLLEATKVASMADTYYIPMAPHNICGPIGTVAAAHAAAAIPNLLVLEFHALDVPWFEDLVVAPEPLIQNGHLVLNDKPGLGVEIDESVARKHLKDGQRFFED